MSGSKRDDDSGATDMEVGMTTAERRRRRRRGGGLRVPSDNVPRRTNPPVVAPVPEDPSLAMSIAYSFQGGDSESVPRVDPMPPVLPEPIAPEAASTVIDPPSTAGEGVDFEMKTREMSSVDLAALGLEHLDPNHPSHAAAAASRAPSDGASSTVEVRFDEPEIAISRASSVDIEVEMAIEAGSSLDVDAAELEVEPDSAVPTPVAAAASKPTRERKERLKTVALSDEDLEEVRAAISQPIEAQPSQPIPVAAPDGAVNRTQPLSVLDIEVLRTPEPEAKPARAASEEPQSVPEIDIQLLSERASDSSGEYEVDVEEAPAEPAVAAAPAAPAVPAAPVAPAAASSNPGINPGTGPTQTPPPPPPAAAKAPPAPPPAAKKEKPAPPKADSKPRGKPWFVDLFDEDYLRTLPFLTPQATQAEAEFVIDAMGLAPGAQVLDVGCGYGRHAMELAARGFHVVGLDLSTPLLVRGGEEAMRRGLQINFVRGDVRELDFDAQFDGAYCLFSTFGYFDDETNKKAIANIARALKPGGKVVIEILNRDYVIADLPTRVWWEGDGCVVLEEVELNYFSSRIQVNRSVVFDDGRQLEQEISVRAYSLHEVGKLMHAAGFRVLEVSGGYQTKGRFFGNQSRHIIVLAERKDPSA